MSSGPLRATFMEKTNLRAKMLIFQSNLKPAKSLCEQNKFTAKHDDVTKLAALVTQR